MAFAIFTTSSALAQTPFVTSTTLGTLRNDITAWMGIRIDVQSSPMTVTALGRMYLRGNNRAHPMKLVRVSNGADVPGTLVTIPATGGIAGQYRYVNLASPVVLPAFTSYYLVTSETKGRDYFTVTDGNSAITTTGAAKVPGTVQTTSAGWTYINGVNMTRGPVNLQYTVPSANIAPTVSLSSPPSGASFTAPANIALAATAADTDGTIAQVQFLSGSSVLATVTAPPYLFPWNGVGLGTYSLRARATDNSGATTTSAPVAVSVVADLPPTVSILTPANGAVINAPATVVLTASAADSDGTVARVEYYDAANSLIGTATASPYTLTLNNVPASTPSYTAKAVDNNGVLGMSAPVSITVNALPTVSLSSPANGTSFTAPANIALVATAADTDGTIAQVQFLLGNTVLTTVTGPPYSYPWNGVGLGNYSLRARATDNSGATTTSAPVAVSVVANQPPTVNILTPADGTVLGAPATVVLTASAADSDGTVARVDYYDSVNNLIGTATASPYTLTLNNVPASAPAYTAKAVDNNGAVGVSAPVAITVNAPPTVSMLTPPDGAVMQAPASVTLTANAADIDGNVVRVDYFDAANNLIGTSATIPFTVVLNGLTPGGYSFTAHGLDNHGAVGISAPVQITVQPPPDLPPTVSILTPIDGVVLTDPASMTLSANALDPDGTIASVAYYDGNNNLLGTKTSSPFTLLLTGIPVGSYVFTAVATDNIGLTATSGPVHVAVVPPLASAPPNDSFYSPQMISGPAGSVSGSNVGATTEPGEAFHAGNIGGSSIWYEWTAPSNVETTFDTVGSSFNTLLEVDIGTGVSTVTEVAENDDLSAVITQSSLSFFPVPGTTYQIAVDGFNGVSGAVSLNWYPTPLPPPPPPANDAFANAQILTGAPLNVSGTTVSSTKEPNEPNHAGDPGGHSVWFQWTAGVAGTVTLDTFGSSFDTLLAVYTGSTVGNLTPVASNNDAAPGAIQSRLTFAAQVGITYSIAIDGTAGAFGSYELNLSQGPPPLPDIMLWAYGTQASWFLTNQTFTSTQCNVIEGLVVAGNRRLLKFGIETRNAGTADWYIGNPVGNPLFVWAPCHGHYHMNGFMRYRLLDQAGNLAAPGFKVGFCISDSIRLDSNAGLTRKYTCLNQGIQKGWSDQYASHTSGQWIDTTGLPDGYYTLEATVNPNHIFIESDYSNNTISVPIIIGTPEPTNDNFANATVLNTTSGSVSQTTAFASKEPGEPNHAGNIGGASVWFQWTATSTDGVIIDTLNSAINTLLAVYTGSSVNALTLIASNDDIVTGVFNSVRSRLVIFPAIGTTYWIAVDGYKGNTPGPQTGIISLNWLQTPIPANDSFANAQVLPGISGNVTGTNLLASLEPGEPNHAGVTGGKSLWYQWTATATGAITIDTLGSNFDTELAVYTGTAINALTIVAQNADVGGSPPYNVLSSVTFNPVVGTTYWIAVDGYRGRSGGLSLNWNQAVLGGAARGSLAQNQRDLTLETTSRHLDLTCSPVEDGGFLLAIHGDPKTDYELESSSDLILWSRVHTVQTDDHGLSLIVDRSKPVGRVSISDPLCGAESGLNPAALRASTPQLFYRARPTDSTATDELIQ